MALIDVFPALQDEGYEVTSSATWEYNCIAWAAGDQENWWWPSTEEERGAHWPSGVHREETIEAFVAAFRTLGYEVCPDGSLALVEGVEKVVLYAKDGVPQHMARQLVCGRWTSKCGPNVDISHAPEGLCGGKYGCLAVVMSRPRAAT